MIKNDLVLNRSDNHRFHKTTLTSPLWHQADFLTWKQLLLESERPEYYSRQGTGMAFVCSMVGVTRMVQRRVTTWNVAPHGSWLKELHFGDEKFTDPLLITTQPRHFALKGKIRARGWCPGRWWKVRGCVVAPAGEGFRGDGAPGQMKLQFKKAPGQCCYWNQFLCRLLHFDFQIMHSDAWCSKGKLFGKNFWHFWQWSLSFH